MSSPIVACAAVFPPSVTLVACVLVTVASVAETRLASSAAGAFAGVAAPSMLLAGR
jgi:hypothetical protein